MADRRSAPVPQLRVAVMQRLEDIANLDTKRDSPNSADWRAVLIYAVAQAKAAIEEAQG